MEPAARVPWPPTGVLCPHCQLLIGAGRALAQPSGKSGAKGTAAGVFSRQANRHGQDDGNERSADEVLEAIRSVAAALGERPERLLMVDYQQLATIDPQLPPLRDVFSSFGSWKSARRQAAGS